MTLHNPSSPPSCSPLCQHPSCWGYTARRHDGYWECPLENGSESDDELPTLKVYNMISDYGTECHPVTSSSRVKARDDVSRSSSRRRKNCRPSVEPVGVPHTTPSNWPSVYTPLSPLRPTSGQRLNRIIVHELMDVAQLGSRSAPEPTRIGCKMVWVPKPKQKPREINKLHISHLHSTTLAVPRSDVTERFRTPVNDDNRYAENKRRHHPQPAAAAGLGSPRRFYGARENRDGPIHVDLFSLPPELLQVVVELIQESHDVDKQKIIDALMQVVPAFRAQATAQAICRTLLKQEKVKMHELQERVVRPMPVPAIPTYILDQHVLDSDLTTSVEAVGDTVADVDRGDDDVESLKNSMPPLHATYDFEAAKVTLNPKQPLPPLKNTLVTSISLGLPAIPTGLKCTKTFTYAKRQLHDFTLAPVRPVMSTVDHVKTSLTFIDSSAHVTCPTESSVLGQTADLHRLREVEASIPIREQVRRQKTPRREMVLHTKNTRYKLDPVPGCPPGSPVSFGRAESGLTTGLEPIHESRETATVDKLESTELISELRTPSRSRGQTLSRPGSGMMTPDTWPSIVEEDFLRTPTPDADLVDNIVVADDDQGNAVVTIEDDRWDGGMYPCPVTSGVHPTLSTHVEMADLRDSERDLYTLIEEEVRSDASADDVPGVYPPAQNEEEDNSEGLESEATVDALAANFVSELLANIQLSGSTWQSGD